MKLLSLCFLLVCLSTRDSDALRDVSCNCGWRNEVKKNVAGKETVKYEYPWMVFVMGECVGSIITRYHVLTSAYCTDGNNPSSMVVSVGKYYHYGQNEHLQQHRVYRIIQHEGFKKNVRPVIHDISVLVLATPISFNLYVRPVCLPAHRFDLVRKYIKLTGWGPSKGVEKINGIRELDLKVISNRVCKTLILWQLNKDGTQLCTYTSKNKQRKGDIGGPLVYLDPETNRYTQVALVSYKGWGSFIGPAVHTDVFAYMSWIRNATQQHPKEDYCTKI